MRTSLGFHCQVMHQLNHHQRDVNGLLAADALGNGPGKALHRTETAVATMVMTAMMPMMPTIGMVAARRAVHHQGLTAGQLASGNGVVAPHQLHHPSTLSGRTW